MAVAPISPQAPEPQVAAAVPAEPADTKVLDSLLSPAKPLSDEEIERMQRELEGKK